MSRPSHRINSVWLLVGAYGDLFAGTPYQGRRTDPHILRRQTTIRVSIVDHLAQSITE